MLIINIKYNNNIEQHGQGPTLLLKLIDVGARVNVCVRV